jgi:hypothetical protein
LGLGPSPTVGLGLRPDPPLIKIDAGSPTTDIGLLLVAQAP